jgi:hypothetical protein
MQLPQPYLFTSPRIIAMTDRPQMAPREGPIADPIYGYHTLWAAEVPFIPAYAAKDDHDAEGDSSQYITHMLERQVRFLYDIAQSRNHLSTLEMRLVSWPQAGGYARVGIVFFGKVFHPNEQRSRQLALELWDKFSAVFPQEAPLSYPLIPVKETANPTYPHSHNFAEWYEPIAFEQLTTSKTIVELRKYEDWPTIRGVGGVLHARDYIPHPFVPALDHTVMARLFETMARQRSICMVAITLRPQRLTDQEVVILHELAGWYQRASRGETVIDNPLADVLYELKSDIFEAYTRSRAELGLKVYEHLVREQRSLFLVRLQVIGVPNAQDDLIEALGSEVMANAGNAYPSRWTRLEPINADLRWARFNLQWLEFVRWGISPLIQQYLPIVRLRQLATVQEAAGAFRLPIAPSRGGLTGLEVRDEPFAMPHAVSENQHGPKLGMILDRGIPTDIPLTLPLRMLNKPFLMLGEIGMSREHVVQEVLKGVSIYNIPWILIRGAEAFGSADSQGLAVRHISIDSLSPTAGLPVHPLLPPAGISLTMFLDALLRVLTASYKLDNAMLSILRQALNQTYREAGWTETGAGEAINLAHLATCIETIAQKPEIPTNLENTLRTRVALPLRDLAIIMDQLLATPPAYTDLWSEPTVIEVGWLGSGRNTTVIQGCLWIWLTLALASKQTQSGSEMRGIVALEDAHSLFAPIGEQKQAESIPSPLIPLILTLARSGIGTILIDQRPDLFDQELTSKAGVTILTKSGINKAQKRAVELIDASARQIARISKLQDKEAVIAIHNSEPVLVVL